MGRSGFQLFRFTPVALLLLAGCNDGSIVQGAIETPTPTATATVTPTPQPTPTPEPCQFYGIDATSALWVIDPVAITAEEVGDTGISGITDIAITSDNVIIGITETEAYQLDPNTGEATLMASEPWLADQNALDATADGKLLVGGETALISYDPATGAKSSEGTMGGGRVFSGDIATVSASSALATAKVTTGSGANDHLYRFNLSSNTSTDEGDLGFPKVFGLDVGCDGDLYGMVATNPPKLLRVDGNTAQTTVLGTMTGGPSTLWGAAGPAEGN